MVKLFAGEADDPAGHADDRRIGRHLAQDDRIGRNARVVADLERAEHLRARADHDVVAERRVPLADVLARAAERHALVEQAVVADLSGLANHNPRPMVDDKSAADPRARMNLNPGPHLRPLRDRARQKAQPAHMQPVRDAVIDRRVQAVVEQDDLQRAARGGVISFICPNVLNDMQKRFLQTYGCIKMRSCRACSCRGTNGENKNPPLEQTSRGGPKTRGSTLISHFGLDAANGVSPSLPNALRAAPLLSASSRWRGFSVKESRRYSFRSSRYSHDYCNIIAFCTDAVKP